MSQHLTISIAQLNPIVGNFRHNTQLALDAIHQAKEEGADVVVFSAPSCNHRGALSHGDHGNCAYYSSSLSLVIALKVCIAATNHDAQALTIIINWNTH